jgi:hypothetical protein
MKRKALSRDDRKRQIQLEFAMKLQSGGDGEMTVADIARLMHLSPSTKLRDMVMELVIEGVLDFRDEPIPGIAKFRRIYSPDPKTFKRPKPEYGRLGRAIKINSKQGSFFVEGGL